MQLVHNGEGLYCLHPPFSEQAKRTLFHLPTQEETSPFKSENEIRRKKKKLQAAMHQAAVHQAAGHQDLLKRTDQNVRPQQACRGKIMFVRLYIKIVYIFCRCQDSKFRSTIETSSVENGLLVLLSKNFFLWIQCPKI